MGSEMCIRDRFTETQLLNHRKSASSFLFIGLMMVMFMLIQVGMFLVFHIKLNDHRLLTGESSKKTQNFADIQLLIAQLNTITNSVVIIRRSKKMRKSLVISCH